MYNCNLSNLKIFWILAFIILLFIRCDDDISSFPYVRIDETFNIDTELDNIQPDEYIKKEGYGVGGIIIYRKSTAVFEVYDAACTHEANPECVVVENEDFNIFTCPCCESSFFIYQEGNVFNGPARRPLKQYRADYEKPNRLHVRN
ncbi:MAG: Rieske 2Fe-2S domain-containing protein [Bacteroidales bacterium]